MKKNYEKPQIRKVKLVPSEAVLAACKTDGSAGPGQQTGCFITLVCSTIGS